MQFNASVKTRQSSKGSLEPNSSKDSAQEKLVFAHRSPTSPTTRSGQLITALLTEVQLIRGELAKFQNAAPQIRPSGLHDLNCRDLKISGGHIETSKSEKKTQESVGGFKLNFSKIIKNEIKKQLVPEMQFRQKDIISLGKGKKALSPQQFVNCEDKQDTIFLKEQLQASKEIIFQLDQELKTLSQQNRSLQAQLKSKEEALSTIPGLKTELRINSGVIEDLKKTLEAYHQDSRSEKRNPLIAELLSKEKIIITLRIENAAYLQSISILRNQIEELRESTRSQKDKNVKSLEKDSQTIEIITRKRDSFSSRMSVSWARTNQALGANQTKEFQEIMRRQQHSLTKANLCLAKLEEENQRMLKYKVFSKVQALLLKSLNQEIIRLQLALSDSKYGND